MTRPIPPQCVAFVAKHEGLRLEPYRDSAGHPTIGWGHLLAHDPDRTVPLSTWEPISEEQARGLLTGDLARFGAVVEAAVKARLSDNQFSALVSLAFNIGAKAFRNSTLVKKLNANDFRGAAEQFAVWKYAGGQLVAGLVKRRADEMALFLKEDA